MKPAPACWDPLACGGIYAENPVAKLDISFFLPSVDSLEIESTQSTKPFSVALIALICPIFLPFFSSPPGGQVVSLVPSNVTDRAGRS